MKPELAAAAIINLRIGNPVSNEQIEEGIECLEMITKILALLGERYAIFEYELFTILVQLKNFKLEIETIKKRKEIQNES